MKLVIIESPYAGDVEKHLAYARECMLDSLDRGEAPLASHLLYTQMLDDNDPDDRHQGIEAGLAWGVKAELTAMYTDCGISNGMRIGHTRARTEGRRVEFRSLRKVCANLMCANVVIASDRTANRKYGFSRHPDGRWLCQDCL